MPKQFGSARPAEAPGNEQEGGKRTMGWKPKLLITSVLATALVAAVWSSPDEARWREPDMVDAVNYGRLAAFAILTGEKTDIQYLREFCISPAIQKINTLTEFHMKSDELVQLQQEFGPRLTAPLFTYSARVRPVAVDVLGEFVVATFTYEALDEIVTVPGKGYIMADISLRYYKPVDKSLAGRIKRKIANLPLLRSTELIGSMGTTGHWAVFDYDCTARVSDYYEFLHRMKHPLRKEIAPRDEHGRNDSGELEIWAETLDSRVETTLKVLYDWGPRTGQNQISRFNHATEGVLLDDPWPALTEVLRMRLPISKADALQHPPRD